MDVEIDALRFARDGRIVLDIPSLRLAAGRTTAILGPNGSGKTTLLRLIAALERPQAGRIAIGGRRVEPDIRTRQQIAFVFQEEVFLRRSVRHNLELGLRLRGVAAAARSERIHEAAELLGIAALLDRHADRLSAGERRRISLARAMCLRAPVMLLDEPLASLDAASYSRLLDELPRLLSASGATTLLVTHSRREALRLGQDLVVLVDGHVLAAGDKHIVVTRPGSAAVAEVLGYTILTAAGRRVAVPPDAFGLGPGPLEFTMTVEEIADLVDRVEIGGRVGEGFIRLTAHPAADMPSPGQRIVIHADRGFEIAQ